jgi:hypothetical protein
MTDPSLETSLETLNITGQQQPTGIDASTGDDIEKILAEFELYSESTVGAITTSFDPSSINEQFDIDAMIDPPSNQIDSSNSIQTQLSGISFDDDDFIELLQSIQKQEPQEHELLPPPPRQSTFIEHYDQTNFYQSQTVNSPPLSVPVGSSPADQKAIDNLIYADAFVKQQEEYYRAAKKSKKPKNHHQQRTTNVGPVDYIHSGGCEPCTTVAMQTDYAYQQQLLEYDAADSKKIQIRCQPRSKFRPRTQNESKNSSHYLRCEEGIKPEYPTINISQTWFFQSDVNLIEVALVGLDKEAHPYALDNKTCSDTFEDNTLIFKQGDPNVIYFRLTNEDFQNGYKTFMIELIKGKQDDVITKELIRTRQL